MSVAPYFKQSSYSALKASFTLTTPASSVQ